MLERSLLCELNVKLKKPLSIFRYTLVPTHLPINMEQVVINLQVDLAPFDVVVVRDVRDVRRLVLVQLPKLLTVLQQL